MFSLPYPPCMDAPGSRTVVGWFPDSTRVLYADGPQIVVAEVDGSGVGLLVDASSDIRFGAVRYVAGHVTHATVSPDGSRVVYAVCRYDEREGRTDSAVERCFSPSRQPGDPKCRVPVFVDRRYAYYSIRADVRRLRYEISVWHGPSGTTQGLFVGDAPVWSPDGSRIAFYVGGDREYPGIFDAPRESTGSSAFIKRGLYTMAADGSDVRQILPWDWTEGLGDAPDVDVPPAWSPDGRQIAVVRREGTERVIYLVEAAGGVAPRRLATTVSGPAWSPDGARLAFARPDGDEVALYTIGADGSNARRVTAIANWQQAPRSQGFTAPPREPTRAWIETVAWSPGGDRLVYTCGEFACVVALDGAPPATLPVALDGGTVAAWSPNGAGIAVASRGSYEGYGPQWKRRGGIELYHVAPDGSAVRLLAHLRPDGTLVPAVAAPSDMSRCANGIVVPNPSANPGLVQDCQVLLGLRDTLDGDISLDWNHLLLITKWDDVVVSGAPPRVTELWLDWGGSHDDRSQDNKMSGALPPEIGQLQELRWLGLSGDGLIGVIPAEIGMLTQLEELLVFDAGLTGPIPRELGNLKNLRHLQLIFQKTGGGG